MNPEIKKRWLAALRSGQYKQARQRLSDGKGFCCLGVLCNLHALETGHAWTQEQNGRIAYLGCGQALPSEVVRWAGLKWANPPIGDHLVAVYNDGDSAVGVRKTGFRKIAELIEECL